MGLNKVKLGEFIELLNIRNSGSLYEASDVRGVNNLKSLMPTKVDISDRDLTKFQIVLPDEFVFNHRTSRNGSKFSITYNNTGRPVICTEDYVVFRIKPECMEKLSVIWLYMFFNRPEFDRYVITNSWGSSTEFYNWEDVCDIDIDLPPIEIQQKYVSIYNAMVANQKAYETGLDDLKLVCDGYIEDLRRKMPCEKIGPYINLITASNQEKKVTYVQGVESSGSFINTRANMQGVNIANYTVVKHGCFAYNPSRINLGSIALYKEEKPCIVSPMYTVFEVTRTEKLIPEYLMLWFSRTEFQRYTWFYAAGSVRDTFDFNLMYDVEFPIPSIEIQQDIVDIYTAYKERQAINEHLKTQIKDICPILIKGSIKEAKEA